MTTAERVAPVYDDEKHEYRVGGERYLSITQCLKLAGITDTTFADDNAMWIGTATHRAIELFVKGTLDIDTLDPELVPRIAAWKAFVEATGFKVTESEKIVWDDTYRVAGRLDILGVLPDGREGIVEIKSGCVPRWTGLQLAGQSLLLDACAGSKPVRERFGLQVSERGVPTVKLFRAAEDFRIFIAAATVARWKVRN